MTVEFSAPQTACASRSVGFSLLEMLVSIALIAVIMSAVFAFVYQTQKRAQGSAGVSESNQSARAALEVLTQEIGQAGYNPNFAASRTFQTVPVYGQTAAQCVGLYDLDGTSPDIRGIHPGDWLSVDSGAANELIQVLSTSDTPIPAGLDCTTAPIPNSCPCGSANQIKAVFQVDHVAPPVGRTTAPWPALSYKFPYATGILSGVVNGKTTSNDDTLEIYGDVNEDGTIRYVVYSLSPITNPPTVLTINNSTCKGSFTLYNLYRSDTPVQFPASASQGTNNVASPLVQNVLYYIPKTGTGYGPTCLPLFGYPNQFLVGITPNQVSVVGTMVVTISVAVSPQTMESGRMEWYTMATEIRPLNLAASVTMNQIGAAKLLPKIPLDLPMANPAGYYPL
jgi:prepilin-type N-terminal cleavage/methylation domain-containing protein